MLKTFDSLLIDKDGMRTDPLTRDLLQFLGAIYLVMGIAAMSADLLSKANEWQPGGPLAFALGVGVLLACQSGQLRLAANIGCWGMLFGSFIHSALAGGLSSGSWVVNPIAITLGGWLMGSRTAYRMAFASAIAAVAIYMLHAMGHNFRATPPLITLTFANVLFGVAAAVLSGASAGTFRRQLSELRTLSAQLTAANTELEARVARRTQELSDSLEELKRAQNELIESEKMAALASMVAGISHELNTPLGNALTVSTTLHLRAAEVKSAMASGSIQRSYMTAALDDFVGMSELIEISLGRAATLVMSFKQVAVAQASERTEVFDLRALVDDLCNTLRPSVNKSGVLIRNDVPPDIRCNSVPGPLGQIILNLLQNAIFHGFDGRDAGTVRIDASTNDGKLALHITDDGVGMDTATLARIFEPFFTTKLGKGGSGLGLAVSYRLATSVLAGELGVTSTQGSGTQFTLCMPLVTPMGA